MPSWIRQTLLTLAFAAPLGLLTACGGGGGGSLFEEPAETPETPDTGTPIAGAPAAIEYVSAEPPILTMQGVGQAGLTQTSTVTFRVVDAQGTPVPNQSVNFTLSTDVGGTHLSASTGTTAEDGTVSVSVVSGSVSTPVRVIATVAGTSFSTQSIDLVITTGVPDQDSFSLSIGTFNPEAYDVDGTQVDVTARLADRYNNPVPDGTPLVFTTEGGSIQGSCTTVGGACTVAWTSQNPRPNDGRSTLVAYAVGEESYTEMNGDGRFGPEDAFDLITQDIGEPFRDDNEDGFWQQGEWFFDFNQNGARDEGDGQFNGWLCDDPNRCSPNHSIYVFGKAVMVMAESFANISVSPSSLSIMSSPGTGGQISFTVTALGARTNQVMPEGTTIQVSTTYGSIVGDSSYTVPNTTDASRSQSTFTLEGEGENGGGVVTIKVTTPKGEITTHSLSVTETVPL